LQGVELPLTRPMKAGLPKINQEQPFSDISRPKMDNIATIIVSELSCEGIPPDNLPEWQRYYNWQRAHGSCKGKTPMDIVCERLEQPPLWEEVQEDYITENKHIQLSNYQRDLQLRKVK